MADVEIKTRITTDVAGSVKSINDLNKEIGETKKALKAAAIGSDEHKNALAQLTAQQQQLAKATSTSTDEQNKSAGAFGLLKEKVGALVPGLKGAEAGASSFNTGLKILAANPIVLIVTGLVAILEFLYKAFTSTKEGAQSVAAVFAGITEAVSVVADRVQIARKLFYRKV